MLRSSRYTKANSPWKGLPSAVSRVMETPPFSTQAPSSST